MDDRQELKRLIAEMTEEEFSLFLRLAEEQLGFVILTQPPNNLHPAM